MIHVELNMFSHVQVHISIIWIFFNSSIKCLSWKNKFRLFNELYKIMWLSGLYLNLKGKRDFFVIWFFSFKCYDMSKCGCPNL